MTFSVFSESCQKEKKNEQIQVIFVENTEWCIACINFFLLCIVSKMQQNRLSVILMLYLFIYFFTILIYVLNSFFFMLHSIRLTLTFLVAYRKKNKNKGKMFCRENNSLEASSSSLYEENIIQILSILLCCCKQKQR